MKVLVIGSGGREHALVWKLKQSPMVDEIVCIPGNGGIAADAKCISMDLSDYTALADFVESNGIGLTIVGPEAPLVGGISDVFQGRGLLIFGPNAQAAQLEGSKSFAKDLMERHNIPTAQAHTFEDFDEALDFLKTLEPPYVVKADGLAAGKGVIIAQDFATAESGLRAILLDRQFGEAGNKVVIEEYMEGQELSLLMFTDGTNILPMVPAQDYKRAYDNDEGLNTGGMGSYSPVPLMTPELYGQIVETVLKPTVNGLKADGIEFRGVIYAGLMITKDGPRVLEYNVRFGDPETQAILPRMTSDIIEPMLGCARGNISDVKLTWTDEVCVTVVLASGGYPGDYETGKVINGLDVIDSMDDVFVFHAGTKRINNDVATAGGRVLNVSALGPDFASARDLVYDAISCVDFDGMHYRNDIAKRAIE